MFQKPPIRLYTCCNTLKTRMHMSASGDTNEVQEEPTVLPKSMQLVF